MIYGFLITDLPDQLRLIVYPLSYLNPLSSLLLPSDFPNILITLLLSLTIHSIPQLNPDH